jgi:hypothetical protein
MQVEYRHAPPVPAFFNPSFFLYSGVFRTASKLHY